MCLKIVIFATQGRLFTEWHGERARTASTTTAATTGPQRNEEQRTESRAERGSARFETRAWLLAAKIVFRFSGEFLQGVEHLRDESLRGTDNHPDLFQGLPRGDANDEEWQELYVWLSAIGPRGRTYDQTLGRSRRPAVLSAFQVFSTYRLSRISSWQLGKNYKPGVHTDSRCKT